MVTNTIYTNIVFFYLIKCYSNCGNHTHNPFQLTLTHYFHTLLNIKLMSSCICKSHRHRELHYAIHLLYSSNLYCINNQSMQLCPPQSALAIYIYVYISLYNNRFGIHKYSTRSPRVDPGFHPFEISDVAFGFCAAVCWRPKTDLLLSAHSDAVAYEMLEAHIARCEKQP